MMIWLKLKLMCLANQRDDDDDDDDDFRLVLPGTFIEVGLQILMETCNIAGRSESVFFYRETFHSQLPLASLALMVCVHCIVCLAILPELFRSIQYLYSVTRTCSQAKCASCFDCCNTSHSCLD